MIEASVQAAASVWLIVMACIVTTPDLFNDLMFRVIPVLLAALLGFQAYGYFVGGAA